jgi:hypothetical protein
MSLNQWGVDKMTVEEKSQRHVEKKRDDQD